MVKDDNKYVKNVSVNLHVVIIFGDIWISFIRSFRNEIDSELSGEAEASDASENGSDSEESFKLQSDARNDSSDQEADDEEQNYVTVPTEFRKIITKRICEDDYE